MSDIESQPEALPKAPKKGKLLKEAQEYKQALDKRGVVYMSRVPPFMKPNKARNMFEQYGEVTRLYLAEEGLPFFPCQPIATHFLLSVHSTCAYCRFIATAETEGEWWKWLKAV